MAVRDKGLSTRAGALDFLLATFLASPFFLLWAFDFGAALAFDFAVALAAGFFAVLLGDASFSFS